jgi:hypothetical protein
MLAFQAHGRADLRLRQQHPPDGEGQGVADAFDFPGFVPAYIRPLFCRGIGPFRWVALSGDPEDIYRTDAKVKELIPDDPHLHRWLDMARERIAFQGLPARICWVGLGERHRLGLAFNEMVRERRAEGADRHRPRPSRQRLGREPQPRDRGDEGRLRRGLRLAAAQRAAQHRLGATWVSLHHGGGVGMGYSQHAGMVIVADGTPAARALERVLWNDPAPASCATPTPAMTARASRACRRVLEGWHPRGPPLSPQLWEGPAGANSMTACRAARLGRAAAVSAPTVYGVNTGFGLLATRASPTTGSPSCRPTDPVAAGLGDPLPRHVRLMIVLKLLGLGRGHSGVRPLVIERAPGLLDRDAMPVIPSQGSVGARATSPRSPI